MRLGPRFGLNEAETELVSWLVRTHLLVSAIAFKRDLSDAKTISDFVEAVRKNGKPAIDGHEGRRSVEIILAVYKAAETGKTVKLPLKSDPVLKARTARKKN